MSRKIVELAAVRETLAKLDVLVAEHPELRSPESQRRLAKALKAMRATARSDLTVLLGIRVSERDAARLDALAERDGGSRHEAAREALLAGLDAMERGPR